MFGGISEVAKGEGEGGEIRQTKRNRRRRRRRRSTDP
jgi:hypothetical protein